MQLYFYIYLSVMEKKTKTIKHKQQNHYLLQL